MNRNDTINGTLMCYDTGDHIRPATEREHIDSIEAAEHDGGAGVIVVEIDGNDMRCYVQD